ncbi:MAG: LpxA family transferase [Chlamydiales bacterium]
MVNVHVQSNVISDFFELSEFAHRALFEGCEYPWDALMHLSSYLKKQKLGKIETEIPEGVFLNNPSTISIGKGTVVEPGTYIQGPCIIGANCQVRHGAYLRGDIITGDHCVIGHATEIKHSILLNHAAAAHFNYVGDSIVGSHVNLGAGVILANLRLDHGNVSVYLGERKIATELKKLGAIIGDRSQLGCNCVLNPGAILGKGVLTFPCLHVDGYIPPHAKVKPAQCNVVKK